MVKHDYSFAVILSDGNQTIHDRGIKTKISREISARAAGILSEVLFSEDEGLSPQSKSKEATLL